MSRTIKKRRTSPPPEIENADSLESLLSEATDVEEPPTKDELGETLLPPPAAPMAVARVLMEARWMTDGDDPLYALRWHRGVFYRRDGTAWPEESDPAINGQLYAATENACYEGGKGVEPWQPTKHKIANLRDALGQGVLQIPERLEPPFWISGTGQGGDLLAMRNVLLDRDTREVSEHSANYFNLWALPYDYDPDAPEPERWLTFLKDLWPDDPDSIALLQEWCGYVLGGDTSQQKILCMVGPPRSGKGTINRVLTALAGPQNTASPMMNSLARDFGLEPLIGKPLVIVPDARFSGKDAQIVVERLLSISGEDSMSIDRKHRLAWEGRLPGRIVITSNELPGLRDASGALANRFLPLVLEQSWLGQENTGLTEELLDELPSILLWALDGLARLRKSGRFTATDAGQQAVEEMLRAGSAVMAFVDDCCSRNPGDEAVLDELYKAYNDWCVDQGINYQPTKEQFAKDLRAACPGIRRSKPRGADGKQHPVYNGITLCDSTSPCVAETGEPGELLIAVPTIEDDSNRSRRREVRGTIGKRPAHPSQPGSRRGRDAEPEFPEFERVQEPEYGSVPGVPALAELAKKSPTRRSSGVPGTPGTDTSVPGVRRVPRRRS